MNTRRVSLFIVPTFLLAALLSACATGTSAPTAAPTSAAPSASPDVPLPKATRNAPDKDELLLISATATAANGATLSLETQVHLAIPFDDVAGQTLPKAMIEDCGPDLTLNILKAQKWSFTRVNTSAIAPEGSTAWPVDARVATRPSTKDARIAARGTMRSDTTTAELPCDQEKYLDGEGNGAIAAGLQADTVDDATRFTRWANLAYGYVAPAGVTLTDCTFTVTDRGKQYGGNAASWNSVSTPNACVIGAAGAIRAP